MSIIAGMKGVKDPAKTATRDSKSEDIHNNPIYVFRTTNKIYDLFKERMEIPPQNQVI